MQHYIIFRVINRIISISWKLIFKYVTIKANSRIGWHMRVGWDQHLLGTQVQRPKIKCDPKDHKVGQQGASTAGWMGFLCAPWEERTEGCYNTTEAQRKHSGSYFPDAWLQGAKYSTRLLLCRRKIWGFFLLLGTRYYPEQKVRIKPFIYESKGIRPNKTI